MENNLKYWLWLSLRYGLGGELRLYLLEEFSYEPWKIYYAEPSVFEKLKLSPKIISSLGNKNMNRVNDILGACDRLGIFIITYQDTMYPSRLRALVDPPIVLYGKGKMPRTEEQPTIAMVGSREASQYGVDMAAQFAFSLTKHKALVVTGMAEGIDTACVQGALKAGGPLISVVAGGVDLAFPVESANLYADVPCVGALLSEYPPGTPHRGGHFRFRNRILSGIATGVMIVESKKSGGTMLTANIAQEQEKDVFVLLGDTRIPSLSGNLYLMQNRDCYPVGEPEHILEFYQKKYPLHHRISIKKGSQRLSDIQEHTPRKTGKSPKGKEEPTEKTKKTRQPKTSKKPVEREENIEVTMPDALAVVRAKDFSEQELEVLSVLGGAVRSQDDILELTKLSPREVMLALVNLEASSAIAPVSSQHYCALVQVVQEEDEGDKG